MWRTRKWRQLSWPPYVSRISGQPIRLLLLSGMCTLQGVDIRLRLADQCKDARTGIAPSGAIEICLEEAFESSWEPSRHRSTAWKELEG